MKPPVVADAGPLIGLARVDALPFLHQIYGEVLVPPQVVEELRLEERRPGSQALARAVADGWLEAVGPAGPGGGRTPPGLDPGEAEAILLAEAMGARFLLIDERRGRAAARARGIPVVGVAGVLLVVKERELIPEVAPWLGRLAAAGYRLSTDLMAKVLRLAGEG